MHKCMSSMFQYRHSSDTKPIEREFGLSVEIQIKYQIMLSDSRDSRGGSQVQVVRLFLKDFSKFFFFKPYPQLYNLKQASFLIDIFYLCCYSPGVAAPFWFCIPLFCKCPWPGFFASWLFHRWPALYLGFFQFSPLQTGGAQYLDTPLSMPFPARKLFELFACQCFENKCNLLQFLPKLVSC